MRKKIVAGNWKMNKNFQDAEELLDELSEQIENGQKSSKVEVIVCPPSLYTEMALDLSHSEDEERLFGVGAQDVSEHGQGAYTGEISADMLSSMGVEYCIVGHSERRKYFKETDEQVAAKVDKLLAEGITPIVCVGELLEDREAGRHFDVIRTQVEKGLFGLKQLDFVKVIIAYEPVWAIGTGKTATPDQAQEVHAFIRGLVEEKYGKEVARNLSILYGGSCNAKNAAELFAQNDVDGGLIGGAALKAEDFVTIINSFK
ncbi:MAG: triose-phosphate isomerase [Bacteroidales bacterium]|nr:triose-phosphate isomerase [Bacteroidales bacterium]